MFADFCAGDDDSSQPTKSELDWYLEENCIPSTELADFDALYWWSQNSAKYPILSHMAGDILAIPITTVASESTFSAGSRVIEPHRACLLLKTVEMLLCGTDWAKEIYGLKYNENEKLKGKLTKVEIELPSVVSDGQSVLKTSQALRKN